MLTLKNSPALNKYNFIFKDGKLSLTLKDKEILTIDINELSERQKLSEKITELEDSFKQPISAMVWISQLRPNTDGRPRHIDPLSFVKKA